MLYLIIDILGTAAFAISGVLIAMDKKLDVFGLFIIAFVTAIGGGTLRDVLIGNTPVVWMQNNTYLIVVLVSVLLAIVFAKQLRYLRKTLFFFDTIGIGLFTMVGVQKGLEANLSPVICVALGTMTASFGGVLRDILCNEIPVIFRKEVYATACIVGGFSYFLLLQLPSDQAYAFVGAIGVTILIRFLAVTLKISLPSIYRN